MLMLHSTPHIQSVHKKPCDQIVISIEWLEVSEIGCYYKMFSQRRGHLLAFSERYIAIYLLKHTAE